MSHCTRVPCLLYPFICRWTFRLFLCLAAATAAAKSFQSCPTLCDPTDGSPPGSPHPWDSPGKNSGVGCHFVLQCMKVKSLSHARLLATPWTAAHQAPPSMGFSRQEYWSRVPLPSPNKCLRINLTNICKTSTRKLQNVERI